MPLSSAAIAPGVVGVAGQKKSIQHLEGGIVKKILVRDGDLVSAGQPLVELSDVSARASYEDLNIRLIQAKAELLRWHAEQQGESDLDGATWTRVHANDPLRWLRSRRNGKCCAAGLPCSGKNWPI